MWQLCAGLAVAALIAAVNLHPDHSGSKSEYLLVALFVALSLLAIFTGAGTYLAKRKRNRASNRLAAYVQHGEEIIRRCHETATSQEPAPTEEANAWANEIYGYLYKELGPPYAVRFNNPAGLPIGTTILMPPYSHMEGGVKFRSARLHEIMTELAGK